MAPQTPISTSTWATITIRLPSGAISLDALRDAAQRLEDLASVLALQENVTGVETRDPQSGHPVERPELVVYTRPEAIAPLEATIEEMARMFELSVRVRSEIRDDEDWKDTWKQFYRPLVFGGDRLLVRPSWIERRQSDPSLEIVIDPGRAFGTGLHQSTQLCLERLCRLAESVSPSRVLDVGCGSGILALAAARLWPRAEIVALDIDPEATETVAENARLNALERRMRIATGDLASVVGSHEVFECIVANIRPEVLLPLQPALRSRASVGARVTLSGILDTESTRVLEAYEAAGWKLDETSGGGVRSDAQWCAIDLTAPRPGAEPP